MSEQEHNSSNLQVRAAEEARTPEVLERRRKLMRMVGTGVPLILSLPTRASAQTLSSAYRAAQQDAMQHPPRESARPDGWIRVKAERRTNKAGGSAYKFEHHGPYFDDQGIEIPNSQVNEHKVDVYMLVLFRTYFDRGDADEGGPWPKYHGVGQALHLSSWSSLSPRGTAPGHWVV